MVREQDLKISKGTWNLFGINIKRFQVPFIPFVFFLLIGAMAQAEEPKENAAPAVPGAIELKMMIVNPSPKDKQTFPMKAYLPEEVKPEDVMDKEDMELVYDADKRTYYAAQDIELEPGKSVVKAIRIKDIWVITEEQIQKLSVQLNFPFLYQCKYPT